MAAKITVAELLVSIGVDAKDAEKAAKKLDQTLGKTEQAAKGLKDEIDDSEKSLERWAKTAEKADKFANILTKVLLGAGAAVAAIGTAVIKTGSDFETLAARLKTATGSAEAAEKALSFVKDFAASTPFQVAEITDAFIKLQNLGIEPTERRLTAFGNIAAGNAKSLDQFTEAVLDASAGEFERLKEFGIRAKQNGDKVALTFRGLTTSVGNNAADITEFLTGIGENDFAGAMAERMSTLEGVISNAKDAFTNFLLEVAQDGPLQEFKGLIQDLVKGAGDKEGLAKILSRTLVTAIRGLRRVLNSDLIGILKTAASALEFVIDNWTIFIGLIAGAKTIQAFSVAATGFQSLGIAAGSALGPIGLVAGALAALIPIAVKAGSAIGTTLGRPRGLTVAKRGTGVETLGSKFGTGTLEAAQAGRQQAIINREVALLRTGDPDSFAGRQAASRLRKAQGELSRIQGRADIAKQRRAEEAAVNDKQGNFFTGILAVASLGQAAFERSQEETSAPATAGGRGRGGGRRAKKAPKKTKVGPPVSVSEFFRQAQKGELGPLAARTPSTKDIEPTVAIDITNNNNTFTNKFVIDAPGMGAEQVRGLAKQVTTILDNQRAAAGQQMASNLVR